jgi:acyl dehydratase
MNEPKTPLLRSGDACQRELKFSRDEIAQFAHLTGDLNPLHVDEGAAGRAHHGRIIASGQQTAAQMIGLVSSHCAQMGGEHPREVLCLNFNFAFKAPVFADDPMLLKWKVSNVEWSDRLEGWIGHVDGTAAAGERTCVIGRGTLLVKPALASDAGKGEKAAKAAKVATATGKR